MENHSTKVPQDVTSDEKLLAMLSHLSILFGGLLIPLIIWITQKEKSQYVRFHSLQAMFYHISFTVLLMLFIFLMLFVMIISGFGLGIFNQTGGQNSTAPTGFIIMMIVFYAVIIIGALAGIAYGLYLALKAYQGYLTKVPILGKIIYKKVYGA